MFGEPKPHQVYPPHLTVYRQLQKTVVRMLAVSRLLAVGPNGSLRDRRRLATR